MLVSLRYSARTPSPCGLSRPPLRGTARLTYGGVVRAVAVGRRLALRRAPVCSPGSLGRPGLAPPAFLFLHGTGFAFDRPQSRSALRAEKKTKKDLTKNTSCGILISRAGVRKHKKIFRDLRGFLLPRKISVITLLRQ